MQKTMSQADSVNLTCLSKLMQNYQAEQPRSGSAPDTFIYTEGFCRTDCQFGRKRLVTRSRPLV